LTVDPGYQISLYFFPFFCSN